MSVEPSLTLAVLTYRRVEQVVALLPALDAQAGAAIAAGVESEVLVVDNDPAASASAGVAAVAHAVPLRYVHEPEPGLAAARNRALDEAGQRRLLVFIDDDEVPCADWLVTLLAAWRRTGAAAVTGPVESDPERPLDDWLTGAALFERPRRASDKPVSGLATNNLLLDLDVVRAHGLRFDARFGATGGEDSMFGQQLLSAGERIVWCDDAVVRERVPAARLERAWVRQRLVRYGESWTRVRLIDAPGLPGVRARAWYAVKGATKAGVGTLRAAIARARHDARGQGRAEAEAAGGWGMLRGALGAHRDEYGR